MRVGVDILFKKNLIRCCKMNSQNGFVNIWKLSLILSRLFLLSMELGVHNNFPEFLNIINKNLKSIIMLVL